jgi:Tol biopolymer transport system component
LPEKVVNWHFYLLFASYLPYCDIEQSYEYCNYAQNQGGNMRRRSIVLSTVFLLLSCSTPTENQIDPPGPTEILAALHYNHQFTVKWRVSESPDFAEYRLYMAENADMQQAQLVANVTDRQQDLVIIDGIDYEKYYYFQIETVNKDAQSAVSGVYAANSYPLIVYEGMGESSTDIFVIDFFGNRVLEFPNSPAYDGWAHFSPDGSAFVFETERDGNLEIYIFDFATLQISNLSQSPYRDADPYFTFDSERILFTSDRFGPGPNVFRVRRDGDYLRPITYGFLSLNYPVPSPVNYDYAVTNRETGQLYISAINTDELTEVPYRFAGAGMPQYSHDGSLLAVSDASAVFITDGIPDMVLVDLSDFSTMRIENAGGYVFSPVLAELYFLRYNNDLTNDIVARSLDGSGESVLLTGGYHAITSVSSDGQSIIYSHRPGAANSDVYRFGRYSGEIVQLSSSGRDNGGGQIQPLPR